MSITYCFSWLLPLCSDFDYIFSQLLTNLTVFQRLGKAPSDNLYIPVNLFTRVASFDRRELTNEIAQKHSKRPLRTTWAFAKFIARSAVFSARGGEDASDADRE